MEPKDATIEILESIRNELHDGLTGVRTEVSGLRGEVSSVRGEVSGLRGEVSTVRAEVSGLRGEVSGLRGEVSSVRTELRNELHDGLTGVRADVSSLREDLRDGLAGVTGRMDRLEHRQTEADLRVATELVALAGVVREVRDAYREERALSHRVDDHERRLSDVEKRVGV
jgi:chromosome segregation ATPase